MTPTEIEATYPPEVVEAWHWLDIHCRHYATPNEDQQTTANLRKCERPIAARCLWILRRAKLIATVRGFRGNFVKKQL